jgi:hypothetical protein
MSRTDIKQGTKIDDIEACYYQYIMPSSLSELNTQVILFEAI